MALTRRQREVLDVIREFIGTNGYSPSLEEIGKSLGLSSVATVHKHVSHLVAKGYARRIWNQNRSIELTPGPEVPLARSVPVVGLLAAGVPIVTVPDGGTVVIAAGLAPEGLKAHALRVVGDSLLPAAMRDGDLVIVEERVEAADGETVVAILDESRSAVATLRRDRDRTWLEAHPGEPLTVSPARVEIRGVLLGLVRRYPKP
ncbi:MAG: transcriptional repressor LexA [Acidobacteriia bacterium]|nr:transcriptional repressor LexA [Terriglobia bacterium]